MINQQKTAMIFGVTGQDGYYLSRLLLDKGYRVIGIPRRSSVDSHTERLSTLLLDPDFDLIEGDITDASSVNQLILEEQPDEIYNLAAQSHVATSFNQPSYTFQVNTLGLLNILEAVRLYWPTARVYQASTSEMFGNNMGTLRTVDGNNALYFQDEDTPHDPSSPYAVSKVAAHNMCKLYRSSYNLFVSCGILFNHESPQRGKKFVTRKVTRYVAAVKDFYDKNPDGYPPRLKLGNLDACRDWGFAGDYVEAMHMMLQHDKPDDFVVATGDTNSIRDLCELAFAEIGIKDWEAYVEIDSEFIRPRDVPYLLGSSNKIHEMLGWKPKTSFQELVAMMVKGDLMDEVIFDGS